MPQINKCNTGKATSAKYIPINAELPEYARLYHDGGLLIDNKFYIPQEDFLQIGLVLIGKVKEIKQEDIDAAENWEQKAVLRGIQAIQQVLSMK